MTLAYTKKPRARKFSARGVFVKIIRFLRYMMRFLQHVLRFMLANA